MAQDADGNWYMTQFTGDKPKNALVSCIAVNDDMINEILNQSLSLDIAAACGVNGTQYVYYEGDYTAGLELANEYKGSNYGGYNLFTNNCLDYAKEILNAGTPQSSVLGRYTKNSATIVPRTFHFGYTAAKRMGRIFK